MSPEQARTGAIDGRADVYSLGATLYELITLRPPFDGQSAAELIDQIKTREPSRPRKFDPRVPLDLETILLKALAKRPDDRYATADALAEDLARFLAHEPVKARRIGPFGRAVRFARRHPSLTAVSTTATALVLSTATFAYVRVVRERDRAEQAQTRTEVANDQLKAANGQLKVADRRIKATMLDLLEQNVANVRLSNEPDRRSKGLGYLRQAAEYEPDPATRVKLRDRALAFLSMRDVVARPAIETTAKPQHGLIFGTKGKRVFALSDRGELEIWDVAGRELVDSTDTSIAPPRTRPQNVRGGMRFRPADLRIASVGDQVAVIQPDGGGVNFHDLASPDMLVDTWPMKGHHVTGLLTASLDGRRLLTISRNPASSNRTGPPDRFEIPEEPRISLWDRDHPEAPKASLTLPPPKLEPLRSGPLLLAISPDGSKIAAARMNETEIALWDGEGHPLPPIPVQVIATTLAIGPTGLLAVAGNGGEIALWDLSPAKPKRLTGLPANQSFVTLLRFDPKNGLILAAAGMGGGVELWDLSTHTLIAALPTKNEEVGDLAFSGDGQTLAAAGQSSGIALWSVVEPAAQHVLPETGDVPRGVAFGPGNLLAIASAEDRGLPRRSVSGVAPVAARLRSRRGTRSVPGPSASTPRGG